MAVASPGWQVIHKMKLARLINGIGEDWIFLTIGEAVEACPANNKGSDLECWIRRGLEEKDFMWAIAVSELYGCSVVWYRFVSTLSTAVNLAVGAALRHLSKAPGGRRTMMEMGSA